MVIYTKSKVCEDFKKIVGYKCEYIIYDFKRTSWKLAKNTSISSI